MRWEPKPYKLNGWAFDFGNDKISASPLPELQDKISAAAERLTHEVAKAENTLMLQSLTDETLENLARHCKNELKKRREFVKKFKI